MNNEVLLKNLRCIPDFPRKGINFRDVTTLYKNAECMKIMLDELYELYKDKGITSWFCDGFSISCKIRMRSGIGAQTR